MYTYPDANVFSIDIFVSVAIVVFPRKLEPYLHKLSQLLGMQNPGVASSQALVFQLGNKISPNYQPIHCIGYDIE